MPPKKKLTAVIKLQIKAGLANPAPPVGPALGQHGVNIMEFCKQYNAATESQRGQVVPVEISVFEDRSFTFITKTPPAAKLILKAAGIEKGSGVPQKDKVATLSQAQVREIAETKMPDLNANDVEAAMKIIAGTARSWASSSPTAEPFARSRGRVDQQYRVTGTTSSISSLSRTSTSGRAARGSRRPHLTSSRRAAMKRSKGYRNAAAKIEADELYTPLAAIRLAKETSVTKFDSSVEVSMRLGIDPRKADQMVRSTIVLPHGTGKTARVLVFAQGDKAEAAREAGADIVGSDELIDEVAKGRLDFDAVVATPDLMGKVGRLGRVLGPRSLMPNPKTGTVTADVAKAVNDIKGGKIEFRADRHSNLNFIIGKVSFSEQQLAENYAAALEEVLRVKPSAAKGRYLKKITFATTMGPGIQVDANRVRNVAADDEA